MTFSILHSCYRASLQISFK